VFWIAFDGLLLRPDLRPCSRLWGDGRIPTERLAGLSVSAYVASKVTALLPVLAGVSAVLLGVLRALGRLPALGWHVLRLAFRDDCDRSDLCTGPRPVRLGRGFNAAQAALALPMLCFPQVLFGGAIVPR